MLQRLRLAAPERQGEEGCAHERQGCELAEENPRAVGLRGTSDFQGPRASQGHPTPGKQSSLRSQQKRPRARSAASGLPAPDGRCIFPGACSGPSPLGWGCGRPAAWEGLRDPSGLAGSTPERGLCPGLDEQKKLLALKPRRRTDGMALNRPECEQTPAGGEGREALACCRPWGRAESDTTERRGKNRIELHQPLDWRV